MIDGQELKPEGDLSREPAQFVHGDDLVWRTVKAVLLLTGFVTIYGSLLAFHFPLYVTIVGTISLAVLNYSILVCIGHDAVHGGFSRSRLVNEIALLALDLSGMNGLLWRTRHMNHHRETNNVMRDPDVRAMPLLRLTPYDQWMPHHRLQAFFVSSVYAFTLPVVQLFDEIGFIREAPKRKRIALSIRSIVGKAIYITWVFVIPISVHGAGAIPFVMLGYCTLSMIVSVIFQVAHNVSGVAHVDQSLANVGREQWQRHQITATTNFGVGRISGFFFGGLDRQIEHHLFPHLPHTMLASKEASTKEICRRLRVTYKNERSLGHAFWSHLRYLHQLGKRVDTSSVNP